MKIKPVWEEKFYIGAYDTDAKGEIKLSKLTGYIQETAWWHANHLALGKNFMHKEGMVWMLAALKIHIDYFPKWMEKITIESWPKGLSRFYYLRDFVLYDQNKNPFAIATTQWLLLDIKSKRPKVFMTDELNFAKDENRNVFEEPIEKLPKVKNGKIFKKQVDYTDMDLNQHLNSNRYIDFILGTFSAEYHKNKHVKDFQINFLKEVKNVDEILIKQQQFNEQEMYLFEGLSKDEKLTHFQSFVGFQT